MNRSILKSYLLSAVSAAVMIMSFPKTDLSFLAWVGLIPLMFALDKKSYRQSISISYFCGFIFFFGTLYWFIYVTIFGAVLLIAYLACYFLLFGLAYHYFRNHKPLARLFLLPSCWVALEWIRTYMFTGFDWASLAHSQYKNLTMIQVADITGFFGISFIVVLVNFFLKELLSVVILKNSSLKKDIGKITAVSIAVISIVFIYGVLKLNKSADLQSRKVAVIQANIEQEIKWFKPAWDDIVAEHLYLTSAAAEQGPDLIIWPETSYPGTLFEDLEYLEQLKELVIEKKIPVLLGAVVKDGEDYFNSAILINKDGEISGRYDKKHLVPYGEYVPFRSTFPFISGFIPIDDFTAGKEFTVFPFAALSDQKFSVLICFEDTISRLSRGFVNNGSQLLVNMTNDGWFKDTKAPFLHLASAVYRTIENRRGLVRAANTGLSVFVDSFGRVTHSIHDENQKMTYVEGFAVDEVRLNTSKTFYTKYGEIFAYLCIGCILAGVIFRKRM